MGVFCWLCLLSETFGNFAFEFDCQVMLLLLEFLFIEVYELEKEIRQMGSVGP